MPPDLLPHIVVMGVSGSGKTTVGELLASSLGVPFVDADDLHSDAAKQKMASGHPLTDDDRWPWLERVGDAIEEANTGIVIACSALKRSYRDAIRLVAPAARFVFLDGSRELLEQRLQARIGHFMPVSLLDSQLATLEPLQADESGVTVPIDASPEQLAEIAAALGHPDGRRARVVRPFRTSGAAFAVRNVRITRTTDGRNA